jgi:FkbM family methyltransferase
VRHPTAQPTPGTSEKEPLAPSGRRRYAAQALPLAAPEGWLRGLSGSTAARPGAPSGPSTMKSLRQSIGLLRSLAIYHGNPIRKVTLRRLYGQFVGPGDLCFDIGSHVGNRIGAFRKLGARVLAVEPQPQCMDVLRRLYGRAAGVTLLEQAVGDRPGTAELLISELTPTLTTLSADWTARMSRHAAFAGVRWERRVRVPVTTLDQLIAQHGEPVFIKIDVEGFEPEVLRGLSRPVRALSFEYLPMAMDTALTCLTLVAALGRYEFNWSPVETHVLREPRWLSAEETRRRLTLLSGQPRSGDVYARLVAG